jgi:hypothetical protein
LVNHDGDNQYDQQQIPLLQEPILQGKPTSLMVIASGYINP